MGIIAALVGSWAYFQIEKMMKRKSHRKYFTTIVEGERVRFEGDFPVYVDMGQMANDFCNTLRSSEVKNIPTIPDYPDDSFMTDNSQTSYNPETKKIEGDQKG